MAVLTNKINNVFCFFAVVFVFQLVFQSHLLECFTQATFVLELQTLMQVIDLFCKY